MLKKKLIAGLIVATSMLQMVPVMASAKVDNITDSTSTVNVTTGAAVQVVDEEVSNTGSRQVIQVGKDQMSYIQMGDEKSDKSIVIIHGSAFNAEGMVPYGTLYAKKGYNVILVDLPGHYEDIGKLPKDFNDLTDDVAALTSKLITKNKLGNKFEVQGWSLGGSIALNLAIRHPGHVSAVGMIDCASNYYGIQLPQVTDDTRIPTLDAVVQSLKGSIVDQSVTDNILDNLEFTAAPTDAVNSDFAIDSTINFDSQLKKVKVPVYDFYGGEDALTTLDKQKEMQSVIKDFKLHVEPGYNHCAVLENPKVVYNAMQKMRK